MSDDMADALDRQASALLRAQAAQQIGPNPLAEYADAFFDYQRATIALRDAELALKAAQEGYRRALEALNKAIAPFPEKP